MSNPIFSPQEIVNEINSMLRGDRFPIQADTDWRAHLVALRDDIAMTDWQGFGVVGLHPFDLDADELPEH